MAKGSMMLSKMRGKMGGMVFRVDPEAGQVVSEYNGSPRNPRSVDQTRQRSKMNLAGCISKITPYSAIAGLATGRRAARSRFVSGILRATSVNNAVAGTFSAMLDADKMVLGEGRMALLTTAATYASADKTLTVSVANTLAEQNVIGARVIVFLFDGNEFTTCQVQSVDAMSGVTPQEVEFQIPAAYETASGYAHVYVVPVWGDNAQATVIYNNIVVASNTDEAYLADAMRQLNALNALGQSKYIGRTDFAA